MTSTGSPRPKRRWSREVVVSAILVLAGSLGLVAPALAAPQLPRLIGHGLALTSVTPGNGARNIAWQSPITVRINGIIAAGSPRPVITPAVSGVWKVNGGTFLFVPTGNMTPGMQYTITVPGGATGVRTTDGAHLPAGVTSTFTAVGASLLRLQQLLAEIGYLPVSFTPHRVHTKAALASEPSSAPLVALAPRAGTFSQRFPHTPTQLLSLFRAGQWSVLDQSAIERFEMDHNMTVDGLPTAALWSAVVSAVAQRKLAPAYNYVLVTETLPERLDVFSNGALIISSLANTGVPGATTPQGTWPVWLRYVTTTMRGTNPNGTTYNDSGIPWVSYYLNSDAVHGYVRASYGFPQSNGCVELPIAAAKVVYPYDPIGTLVTVTTGAIPV